MKILHVEPIQRFRVDFARELADTKYTLVGEAVCGDEAIALIESVSPDIVVMCIATPGHTDQSGGGGLQLLGEFAAKGMSRIVVTYTVDTSYLVMSALKGGAVARVRKPFRRKDVLEALSIAETGKSGFDAARRRRVRLRIRLPVKYKRASEGFFVRKRHAISEDLSVDGIGIVASEPIPEGTVVVVEVELPEGRKPIGARAQVKRCRGSRERSLYSIGLAFTQLNREEKDRLQNYILTLVSSKQAEEVTGDEEAEEK
jgi:DNA-binding NarL/FixJ family response regulator